MADAADATRGIQYAHDLRDIRRANGISIDDIHNESKIPVGLIESFEENGLFDHTMFNRVYLRSFVRTYADVVGIPAEEALESLEAALDGTYNRELAIAYLGHEQQPAASEQVDAADDDLPVIPEPVDSVEAEESPADATRVVPETPPPVVSPPPPRVADEASRHTRELESATTPTPAGPVDTWTAQSPPPGTRLAERRRPERAAAPWGYIFGGLILLIAVVWGVMQMTGRDTGPTSEPIAAAVDTTDAIAQPVNDEPPPPVTLGETMNVTIASADSQLVQDIKVTVDDDLRRPYWLERGERRTFTAANRIVIERELDVIDLLLENRPYPTDRTDEQGRIVITRDMAEQFLSQAQ